MTEAQVEANVAVVDSESETTPEEPQIKEYHPIAQAINTYLHRARDCEESARVFIPLARRIKKAGFQNPIRFKKRERNFK